MSLLRVTLVRRHLPIPYTPELCRTIDHSNPETLMSPFPGGPIYRYLRHSITYFRRYVMRERHRWCSINMDVERAAFYGTPDMAIDPRKNQWSKLIDTYAHGGLTDRVSEDFLRYVMFFPVFAFFVSLFHSRLDRNKKYEMENELDFIAKQAGRMKSDEISESRKKFEKSPVCLQRSLFFDRNQYQEASFEETIMVCRDLRGQGNVFFRNEMFRDAQDLYEKAAALLYAFVPKETEIFETEWTDEDLNFFDLRETCEYEEDRDTVTNLLIHLYCNIANCEQVQDEIVASERTCLFIIKKFSEECAKAHYLLGKAQLRKSDFDESFQSFSRACELEPKDPLVLQNLEKLKSILRRDREKMKTLSKYCFRFGKKQFSIQYFRNEEENKLREALETKISNLEYELSCLTAFEAHKGFEKFPNKKKKKIQELNQLRGIFKEFEKTENREKLIESLEKIYGTKKESVEKIDFGNPSETMIDDAKQHFGVNLRDPATRELLERLKKSYIDNAKLQKTEEKKPRRNYGGLFRVLSVLFLIWAGYVGFTREVKLEL